MKRLSILFLVFLLTTTAIAQQIPDGESETDSSYIKITVNSVCRIYTETYKYKDSIWHNSTFINDTKQLCTEGWQLKNGRPIGIWKHYTRTGEWLYTRDYDKHTCVVNPQLFPYHGDLKKMKHVADSMIIAAYGKDFMKAHVIFEFDCHAFYRRLTKTEPDSAWFASELGTWIEPMTSKPNYFIFRYEVRLNKTDENYIELGIRLDEKGNFLPTDDLNNYGFELVKPENRRFLFTKNTAIEAARRKGLTETDTNKIGTILIWENFQKRQYYNGQFRYYVTELTDRKDEMPGTWQHRIVSRYNVFVFNPWTGEFVEQKKMKRIQTDEKSDGLVPDIE